MQTAICLLFLINIALTSSFNANSQTNPDFRPPPWVGIPMGSTKEGASPELMVEYSNIVSKYGDSGEQWWTKLEKNISMKDRDRLVQIFKQMNADQQGRQRVAFIKPPQPLKKIIPSDKQFISWKNGNVYGVWIDGKKMKNSILDNHKNTDFEHVTVSKLYGVAKQNKKYNYQVDLLTKGYCQEYNKATAKKGPQMVFIG